MNRFVFTILSIIMFTSFGFAQNDSLNWGIKFRMGGRYDNLRMCVASPAGAKGGMAADISLFKEITLKNNTVLHFDLPVMRPILFASAFKMLQFEPTLSLKFKKDINKNIKLLLGPTLGFSLHYGPDYKEEETLTDGANSFFAMGPILGGYFGIINQTKSPRLEYGISPFITPLFSISDSQNRNGIIIGGLFDIALKF